MINKKAKTLIENYVVEQLKDSGEKVNKLSKLQLAGYSETAARKNISRVENSNYYLEISSELAMRAGYVATKLMASVDEDVAQGELENYDLKDKINILSKLVQIRNTLTPNLKEKETYTTDNGTLKTVWKQLG